MFWVYFILVLVPLAGLILFGSAIVDAAIAAWESVFV